jgi:hypothetical protein
VTGQLAGRVLDNSGAVVPQATVTTQLLSTHGQRSVLTDGIGSFTLSGLADGDYSVHVHRDGFADAVVPHVTIAVGSVAQIEITLQVSTTAQEVTVEANASILEPQQASTATVVDKERIEESPVQNRNFLNFILLAPGVTPANPAVPSASATFTGGFGFAGLRPRSNSLLIDGVSNNDEFTGDNRTEISLEEVQEFQVVNHGYAAESGGGAAGSVDVVTRAGGNDVHGDAFVFAQNGTMDARPALEAQLQKPDINRERIGLSLGGPIRKDRTFYHASLEDEYGRAEDAPDFSPLTLQSVQTALPSYTLLNGTGVSNAFLPTERQETEASARLDRQMNPANLILLRIASTNNREVNEAFHASDIVASSGRGSAFISDQALIGGWTRTLSARALNDLRAQAAIRRIVLRTAQQSGPGIEVPGVLEAGRPYYGNGIRHENYFEANDGLSLQHRSHLLKWGASATLILARTANLDGMGGLYVFPDVQDLANGNAIYFEQRFGAALTNFSTGRFAAFAQDHWTASRRLTLDYGLRYDYNRLPEEFHQDWRRLSPRIGIAWQPAPQWIARLGFGIFTDRYPLAAINDVLANDGRRSRSQIAEGADAAALFRGNAAFSLPLPGIAPSYASAQAGLVNSYSELASLGIEHSLAKDLSVGAIYSFTCGVHLLRTANVNLLPPVVLTAGNAAQLGVADPTPQQMGRRVFGPSRVNTAADRIDELQSTAGSNYNGLTLTLNRRMAQEFELLASYTWSHTFDDASDYSEQPEDPHLPRVEYARSLNDQRQLFVLSALWDLPIGDADDPGGAKGGKNPLLATFSNIEAAPILSVGSGRPANPLTSQDATLSHMYPFSSRPLGLARNSLTTPMALNLDLRILRTVRLGKGKLDIVAESFNLLNHTNVERINSFYGTGAAPAATFAMPIQTSNARQIQFSLDYEF